MTLHGVTRSGAKQPPDRVIVMRAGLTGGWVTGNVSCSSAFVYAKTGVESPSMVCWDPLDRRVWAFDDREWNQGTPAELSLREQIFHDDYVRSRGGQVNRGPVERSREEGDEQAAWDAHHEPHSVNVTGFEFAPDEEDDELDEEEEEDTQSLEPCPYCGVTLSVMDDLYTNGYSGERYHMRCAIEAESDT